MIFEFVIILALLLLAFSVFSLLKDMTNGLNE